MSLKGNGNKLTILAIKLHYLHSGWYRYLQIGDITLLILSSGNYHWKMALCKNVTGL